jgi:Tol biopolymer transport system component
VKSNLWRSLPVGFDEKGAYFYAVETQGRAITIGQVDPQSGSIAATPLTVQQAALARAMDVDWSPDGKSLAYRTTAAGMATSIAIRALETGETREFPLPPDLERVAQHRWLADGTAILLSASVHGQWVIFRLDPRTGRVDRAFDVPQAKGFFAFDVTPDARAFVYRVFDKQQDGEYRIISRDLATGAERVVHRGRARNMWEAQSLAVSPDGASVAFLHWAPGAVTGPLEAKLMTVPLAGGAARELTTLGEIVWSIEWARDGRSVLLAQREREGAGRYQVYRVNVGGGPMQPTGLVVEAQPKMRMDRQGGRLAVASGAGKSELWVMENIPTR